MIDWQSASNIATAAAGTVAVATAVSLSGIWLLKRRRDAQRRLSVKVERPSNELFQLVVEYRPSGFNQAHFAEIGSLGSNPIFLLPKLHDGLPANAYDDLIAGLRWPKRSGQWTEQRLRKTDAPDVLRAVFRIIPRSTEASGWLHVRVYTRGPRIRTLLRKRVPVSLLDW